MTNAATYTGSLHRCEGALRVLACRAEWLLAEHMLSSPRTHSDLLGMELVWRTQDEGFDTSFRESSFQAVRSAEASCTRCFSTLSRRIDDQGDAHHRAIGKLTGYGASPPAETDNCHGDGVAPG